VNRDAKALLEKWHKLMENKSFVSSDPISIPHRFSRRQDIEIAGFFSAIMSWGNRTTIINKANELMNRMDNSPYSFVCNSTPKDLRAIEGFVHRTLNATDILYLIDYLHRHYADNDGLESAFFPFQDSNLNAVEIGLIRFHQKVFSSEYAPKRTRKHIANPTSGSACKRLNMFLRWMVRSDVNGIDFGIWTNIKASQLICPLDVHVHRKALEHGLLSRKQSDWKSAIELTENLRELDPTDPVKYDYALFGMGVSKTA
jgi:uncharacterized protein (TIGR02757 family)